MAHGSPKGMDQKFFWMMRQTQVSQNLGKILAANMIFRSQEAAEKAQTEHKKAKKLFNQFQSEYGLPNFKDFAILTETKTTCPGKIQAWGWRCGVCKKSGEGPRKTRRGNLDPICGYTVYSYLDSLVGHMKREHVSKKRKRAPNSTIDLTVGEDRELHTPAYICSDYFYLRLRIRSQYFMAGRPREQPQHAFIVP